MADMKTPKLYNEPRLLAGMAEAGLDAIVTVSPDSFYYVSGSYQFSSISIRDRVAMSVVPRNGDPFLVICRNEEGPTRRFSPIDDIAMYTEFVDSPMEVLGSELVRRGFGSAKIGIEKKFCTAYYFEALANAVPNATLVSADDVLDNARMVKTPVEIELLKKAAVGTDKAIYTAMEMAREGHTELDLVGLMVKNLTTIGGSEFKYVTWGAAAGENVLTTHYTGGHRKIAKGDQVRLNIRASWMGYYSHLYRNAWVGTAPDRHADVYKRLHALHMATVDLMRPGNVCADVYERIKKLADKMNLTCKGAHVGHSTGILLHENPRLQPLEKTILEAGMVIAVEPSAIEPGFGVYHIEDLVVITEGDPVILSDYTDTSEPFLIR